MPSRINMGPDGGPYIAINENSGNIELEDNTGTTVAIWDDANSQWDFQNNPISNVDSLTSNSLNTRRVEYDQGFAVVEDDNSPYEFSGQQSQQFTLSGEYDHVEIRFDHIINVSGSTQAIELLIDGSTTYDYILVGDGSATTGTAQMPLCSAVDDSVELSGSLSIDGRQSLTRIGVRSDMALTDLNQSDLLEAGEARGATSPLDTITVRGASGNIDMRARVIGYTL